MKSHLSPAGILAEAMSMTHSDMLYRLDIKSTCYFYEPFLFQISAPWKFIKTLAFPCLMPLLQLTVTQITIPINILIYFKYYAV